MGNIRNKSHFNMIDKVLTLSYLVTIMNEGVGVPELNEVGVHWKDVGSFFLFVLLYFA